MAGFRVLNRRLDEQDAKLLFAADAIEAAKTKEIADMSEPDRQALLTYYVAEVNPSTKAMSAQLHGVDAERYEIVGRSATTFVQQERTDTQPSRMFSTAGCTIRCATKFTRTYRRCCRRWRHRCRATGLASRNGWSIRRIR